MTKLRRFSCAASRNKKNSANEAPRTFALLSVKTQMVVVVFKTDNLRV